MLNRKCTFLENTRMLKRTLRKTGSVRQFVCTVILSNYLELTQYENPNSTLKQSKDTNRYSCSYKNLCESLFGAQSADTITVLLYF